MSHYPSANYAVPGLMPIPTQVEAIEILRTVPEGEILHIDFFVGDLPPERVTLQSPQGTELFCADSRDFLVGPYTVNPSETCWTVLIPECKVPEGSSYLVFTEEPTPSTAYRTQRRVRIYRHDLLTASMSIKG